MALFKYNKDCMKLEANCLTRLGRYKEASSLIYGVFQLGDKTPDTLSMLAAQYKSQAIFNKDNTLLPYNDINRDLLKRSLSLYIEAFRLNIEDYYSAINVAYLYKLIGKNEEAKRLAKYIEQTHKSSKNKDWWLGTTLLECRIIVGDFNKLDYEFHLLIAICSPNFFQKRATYIQLNLYAEIMGLEKELFDVLESLQVS